MPDETLPRLSDDPRIRFGYAHAVLVLTLLAAGVLRLGDTTTQVLVALVMGAFSACLPWAVRPAVGVIAWAFVTGFVVNGYGQLTFGADDDRRLVAFVVVVAGLAPCLRTLLRARTTS